LSRLKLYLKIAIFTLVALSAGASCDLGVINLSLVSEGLTAPICLAAPNDGTGRLFVADQAGVVWVLEADGTRRDDPFLNISDRVVRLDPGYDERGLLGLALHPEFKKNGKIFVYYSAPLRKGAPEGFDHTGRLSLFNLSLRALSNKTDGLYAIDPTSEKVIMEVDEPQPNNNGGSIAFGPDGLLYLALGDGGRADDIGVGHAPEGNGQNLSTPLGKILRIDVDTATKGKAYGIPHDNPFSLGGGIPEIFAYGFRDPKISFDLGGNHSILASDPGQIRWQEIDLVVRGGNYGWNIKEGSHCFNSQDRSIQIYSCPGIGRDGRPLLDPFIEYSAGLVSKVVGGFVYRGIGASWLNGSYILGDRSWSYNQPDGRLMVAFPSANGRMWNVSELKVAGMKNGRIGAYIMALGEGADGEIYLLTSRSPGPSDRTGRIYKIVGQK
jgi:glucose/arabinose dehydrogenase